MRSLHYSGTGEDGASLVVRTDDGEHFVLPVDDALREAVTGAPAPVYRPPNRAHADPGAELTPRDIQVRVRAGESAEDLAAETGAPLERIMRFAFPVIEERGRVAEEARRSRARRDGDGALVPFGETVDGRFAAHDIDPAGVGWDSVRRADGTWLVIASWHGGDTERQAHWAFSLNARTVLAADEVAADLLSERPLRPVVRAVPDLTDEPGEVSDVGATGPLPDRVGYDRAGYDDSHAVYDGESGAYSGPPPMQAPGGQSWPAEAAPNQSWPTGAAPNQPWPTEAAPNQPSQSQPWQRPADQRFGEDPLPPAPSPSAPNSQPAYSDEHHGTPPLPLAIDEDLDDGLDVIGTYRTGPLPGEGEIIDVYGAESSEDASGEGDAAANGERPTDQTPPRRGSGRSKAAREQTKIPSWDDILLGVRRKQD